VTRRSRLSVAFAAAIGACALASAAAAIIPEQFAADEPGPRSGQAAYEYDAQGKRDPFRPFALQTEPQTLEPQTPLQRYEIGQLKLVGVILKVDPPRAMVEDDQGLGFILMPGTPVGPNGGVVTSIQPRQVVVVEWQTDVIGEKHRKEYVLELPSDESMAEGIRR
jgi:type IV pilus assembly protein PilP